LSEVGRGILHVVALVPVTMEAETPDEEVETVMSCTDRKARVNTWSLSESAAWARATCTVTGWVPSEGLGYMTGLSFEAVEVGVGVKLLVGVAVAGPIVTVAPMEGRPLKLTAWPLVPAPFETLNW
jgi:hypothetical protein